MYFVLCLSLLVCNNLDIMTLVLILVCSVALLNFVDLVM